MTAATKAQTTEAQVAEFGEALVERIVRELHASPAEGYEHMADIVNLAGASTGFARVYTADRIRKITHLSIDIMPGAKYFNIVVCPEDDVDAPRFAHEGMVSVHGSQVSTDLYHDVDMAMNIRSIVERTAGLTAIFNEAKASGINFVPSRQVHMRAFCSPHFLNVFGADGDELPQLAAYADRYFTEWLQLFAAASTLKPSAAQDRRRRRIHMSDQLIVLAPDRNMVVQVYGEETVQAIEQTVMY